MITGATGTVGRQIVEILAAGGESVGAVSRDPSRATWPEGTTPVKADPSSPSSLAAVLRQTKVLFLNPATTSGLYAPAGDVAREFLALAAESGVERVVLLSGAAVDYGAGDPLAEYFVSYEDAVAASGLAWTYVRPGEFAANALAWVPQVRAGDVVRDAYPEAATSAIHERDIAAVAALALRDSSHAGTVHILDGTEALTKRQKLALIGEAIGRELSLQEVPAEAARQAMMGHGISEPIAATVLEYQEKAVTTPGPSSDSVERILGRPALDFATWTRDNARAFGG
ncbi:MAG: NAD(P)H-binding protein [Actinobacteria bacterium]|nr:NAD(P)H-binding protein [Actinomycetota bacterium]